MCDYSLAAIKSRAAEVADKLETSGFGNTTTHGLADPAAPDVAVCVLPGTELAFEENVKTRSGFMNEAQTYEHKVARFRQVNLDQVFTYHDALEFPDGQRVMLHQLEVGQKARVLQLPATPKTAEEALAQKRAEYV